MSGRRARRERRRLNELIKRYEAQTTWVNNCPGLKRWWRIPQWLAERPIERIKNENKKSD